MLTETKMIHVALNEICYLRWDWYNMLPTEIKLYVTYMYFLAIYMIFVTYNINDICCPQYKWHMLPAICLYFPAIYMIYFARNIHDMYCPQYKWYYAARNINDIFCPQNKWYILPAISMIYAAICYPQNK
jgi:hypothetical protein